MPGFRSRTRLADSAPNATLYRYRAAFGSCHSALIAEQFRIVLRLAASGSHTHAAPVRSTWVGVCHRVVSKRSFSVPIRRSGSR